MHWCGRIYILPVLLSVMHALIDTSSCITYSGVGRCFEMGGGGEHQVVRQSPSVLFRSSHRYLSQKLWGGGSSPLRPPVDPSRLEGKTQNSEALRGSACRRCENGNSLPYNYHAPTLYRKKPSLYTCEILYWPPAPATVFFTVPPPSLP